MRLILVALGVVACDSQENTVEFFYDVDMTDIKASFVARSVDGQNASLLLSHGWILGTLRDDETLSHAQQRFDASDNSTWPQVKPASQYAFVDRYGRKQEAPSSLRVHLERLRAPTVIPPRLSLLFVRWGGRYRMGESASADGNAEVDEYDSVSFGGWGDYGSPPADWYIEGVVKDGLLAHPEFARTRDVEVLSLFLGPAVASLPAHGFAAALRGSVHAGYWMLWPSSFETDFDGDGWIGFVDRRELFPMMRAFETAGITTAFPHPASVYEAITSKEWHVHLADDPENRLPAAVFVDTGHLQRNTKEATSLALKALNNHPSARGSVDRGVIKLGWSWEAKGVKFWKGAAELAPRLRVMASFPHSFATQLIVQEWVPFEFEMRLFFAPPADWTPSQFLEPLHTELNTWRDKTRSEPLGFEQVTWEKGADALGGEAHIQAAYQKAIAVSQRLLRWLYSVDPRPVPIIRLDFMVASPARTGGVVQGALDLLMGPSKQEVQVSFGEFCEAGFSVLKWKEGPSITWRQTVEWALRFGRKDQSDTRKENAREDL